MSQPGTQGFVLVQTIESDNPSSRSRERPTGRRGRPAHRAGDQRGQRRSQRVHHPRGWPRAGLPHVGGHRAEDRRRARGVSAVLSTAKPSVALLSLGPNGLEPVVRGDAAMSAPDCDRPQVGFSRNGKAARPDRDTPSSGRRRTGSASVRPRPGRHRGVPGREGAAAASSHSLADGRLTPITASPQRPERDLLGRCHPPRPLRPSRPTSSTAGPAYALDARHGDGVRVGGDRRRPGRHLTVRARRAPRGGRADAAG